MTALGSVSVVAGSLGMVAAVAMFIRWRIDGRAQSWWLAFGYVVVAVPALLDLGGGGRWLYLSAFPVAVAFFVGAWRTPEVDSTLSVRRGVTAAAGAVTLMHFVLTVGPPPRPVTAGGLALAFLALALVSRRSGHPKPSFVLPLLGFALCCAVLALVSDGVVAAAEVALVQLLVNGVLASTALGGLQLTATQHRALALDAQRERELLMSLRAELEDRYAETLHEVGSTALAVEGRIQVVAPNADPTRNDTLMRALAAELQRMRAMTVPDEPIAPADFPLVSALRPLVALSHANAWPVRWDVDEHIVVTGRPTDVTQILLSLVSNARKYAPEGPVGVSSQAAGDFVFVFVDDSGPGVSAAHRERIFERGERADSQRTVDGHGLGLHIARRLARALGGDLWVEPRARGGARFVLALRGLGQTNTRHPSCSSGRHPDRELGAFEASSALAAPPRVREFTRSDRIRVHRPARDGVAPRT
jgi:signal transduction histidine kinase